MTKKQQQQEQADKPKDLINIYQDLKDKYRNYDTRDALKRMQAFRNAVRKLGERGFIVGLEILGSLNFGIVERHSDADLIILHYCDLHRESGECTFQCPNLIIERDTISQVVAEHLSIDKFDIQTLDCINLYQINHYTQEQGSIDNMNIDTNVFRFLFYCTIGRPVNLSLFSPHYKTLIEDTELMQTFSTWASEILAAYLETADHRFSFHKYNERILSQGLQLPPELVQEMKYYLNES